MNLFESWLTGSGFSSFRFDTRFTLYFTRENDVSFSGHALPYRAELQLPEEWWFGSKTEWLNKVSRFGDEVKLDEPVKAFRLAKLRWSEGASVKNSTYQDGVVCINFENGTSISVALESDTDYSLILTEAGIDEDDANWSVIFDKQEMVCKLPGA